MQDNTPPDRRTPRSRAGIRSANLGKRDRDRVAALSPAERRRLRRNRLLGKRNPAPRRRHRSLRIVLILITLMSTLGLAGLGTLYVGYTTYLGQLPDAATLASQEPALDTHVYARDGTLIKVFSSEGSRHEHAALAAISWYARRATIDIEDRHFYENGSWDLPRIIKAGWGQIRHQSSAGGASTITEQLAKISFLEDNGTISYKIKEFILGTQIEANFSKDQILEMYLNRVAYGNHAIGLETAALLYFQKHAKDLDLAQAAMLAGLPNSPSVDNPLLHDANQSVNPLAKQRQFDVLQAMVNNADITQAQSDAAFAEPLTYHGWWEAEPNIHLAPDFLNYLEYNYLKPKYGDAYQNPGGWEIYTTVDLARQRQSDKAVHDGVKANVGHNMHDGAMVSLDPKTGEIMSMTGSWNYDDPGVGQLNMAKRPLQPGSTIKLFTYTSAIATRMYTVASPILDARITYHIPGDPNPWTPNNYDHTYHGWCLLAQCIGNSYNIPAVKTEVAVGVPYISSLEIAAGLASLQDIPGNLPTKYRYAATLGSLTDGISPLELADGAATIADLGVHHDPAPVLRIVDAASGRTLYQYDPNLAARRVVPENVAFIMNEVTSNDNNRVRAFGANSALTLPDRRVSAKTGTTDFFVSNWTVGWTPDIVTAIWVGNPSPSCLRDQDRGYLQSHLYYGENIDDPFTPGELAAHGLKPRNNHCGHLEGTTGVTGAAPTWNSFMYQVLKGTPVHWYAKPSDVYEIGNGDNGQWFLPGTGPTTSKPICGGDTVCTGPAPPKPPPTPGPKPTPTPGPPLPPTPH